LFPLSELPQLPRGKGNKILSVPSAKVQAREEYMIAIQVLGPGDTLVVHSGKRHLSLSGENLMHYRGERGRRGLFLPQGLRRVETMRVERKEK
jgi:topoisomerase-4 subunit A